MDLNNPSAVNTGADAPSGFDILANFDSFAPQAGDAAAAADALMGELTSQHSPAAGEGQFHGEGMAVPTDASGGGTPAGDDGRSPMIPRNRFDEVNTRMQTAEERLRAYEQQYGPLGGQSQPGASPLDTIPAWLQSPAQPQQQQPQFQAPPQAQQPQAAFPTTPAEFHAAQGGQVAFEYLEPWEQAQVRTEFTAFQTQQLVQQMQDERRQEREAFEQQRQQQQMLQAEQQLQGMVRGIVSQPGNEIFQGQFMSSMLAEAIIVGASNGVAPAEVVRRIKAEITTAGRNDLAAAALGGNSQFSQAPALLPGHSPQGMPPATAGGASPSPAVNSDWVTKSDQRTFNRLVRERMAQDLARG